MKKSFVFLILGFILVGVAWWSSQWHEEKFSIEDYNQKILPLLVQSEKRNTDAANRSLNSLKKNFDAYRSGINGFTDDIAAWGAMKLTTLQLTQKFKDWYARPDNNEAVDFVGKKFGEHIFSSEDIIRDSRMALRQFNGDITASRNQLYAELDKVLSDPGVRAKFDAKEFENIKNDLNSESKKFAEQIIQKTASPNIQNLILGNMVGPELVQWITNILVKDAEETVATEALATFVSLKLVPEGATVGSIFPGGGTFIGAAAGFVTAGAIMHVSQQNMKESLTTTCNNYVTNVEKIMLRGSKGKLGLTQILDEAAKISNQSQREACEEIFLKKKK